MRPRSALRACCEGIAPVPNDVPLTDLTLDSREVRPWRRFPGLSRHAAPWTGLRRATWRERGAARHPVGTGWRACGRRNCDSGIVLRRSAGLSSARQPAGGPFLRLAVARAGCHWRHRHQRQDHLCVAAGAGAGRPAAVPLPTWARWARLFGGELVRGRPDHAGCRHRAAPARGFSRARRARGGDGSVLACPGRSTACRPCTSMPPCSPT